MSLAGLAAKNLKRNKLRTILTAVGVAVALLVFMLLRTVLDSWYAQVDYAAKDRLGTRHKVTFIMPLDKTYVDKLRSDEVRQKLGIKDVTWLNWFGGKDPADERSFFASMAVDHETALTVYDEIKVPPDQVDCWNKTLDGAIVGESLAKKKGWKPGQQLTLESAIFPGEWKFTICGIYTTTSRSVDKSSLWFRWDYFNKYNEARKSRAWANKVGWIVTRIDDPKRAGEVSKAIDAMFEEYPDQTLTMSEKALNMSFMGMFSAVLKAMDVVSIVILLIMALILGNTIAMGVRERTSEYGVLRAVGFLPRHIAQLIVVESMVTGLLGAAIGLGITYPLINFGVGKWLEENMGGMFPYFRISGSTAGTAVLLSIVLAIVAATIPALRAARLKTVDAIRQVG